VKLRVIKRCIKILKNQIAADKIMADFYLLLVSYHTMSLKIGAF